MENSAIQFINISPEDLANRITEAVTQFLQPKEADDLLTKAEAMALLKVSPATFDRIQKKAKFGQYMIGDTSRYKKSEILNSFKKVNQTEK